MQRKSIKDLNICEPDGIWYMFNVTSEEEYLDKYFFEGRFHSSVPEDVIESYETVEYLMAFAWYHYEIYDSAVTKLLMTLEMAVKLRAKEKGIALKYEVGKGRKRDKNLQRLIKEVTQLQDEDERMQVLNNLRNVRNILAHPKNRSSMGALIRNKVVPAINAINELFREERKRTLDHEDVAAKVSALNGQCLVVEVNNRKLLISGMDLLESFEGSERVYLLFLEPVLENSQEYFEKGFYPQFISLRLTSVTAEANEISAIDEDGYAVKIFTDLKDANLSRFQEFLKNKKAAPSENMHTYEHGRSSFRFEERELFRYDYYWC